MGNYTTIELVSAELKGVTISSSSVPSSTTVENWIGQVESEIDLRTGRTWSSTVITNEIVDYDGSGYLRLPYSPIIAVSSMAYETQGLGASSDSWTSLVEGRTNDYILFLDEGEVKFFGSNIPVSGFKNLKWSGTIGYVTTPKYIERLATLMTVQNYVGAIIGNDASKSGRDIAVGTIRMSAPKMFSSAYIKSIGLEVDNIFTRTINATHVFRPKRSYGVR